MRVLEVGKSNVVERWTTKCPFCASKVQINKGYEYDTDVTFDYYAPDSYIVRWRCPVCKEGIISSKKGQCSKNTEKMRNFSYAEVEEKVLTADEICQLEKELKT